MPTNDPITTDRLIASIREGIAAQPALTAHARPVADSFTTLIHYRMPQITAADGDLMIHIAAFLADVMTALTAAGEPPVDAITTATSAIAIAGLKLHDSGETPTADDDAETADAAARLRAWFKAEGPLVMDEEDLDDVQKVLAAYERGTAAQPAAEQDNAYARVRAWVDAAGGTIDSDEIVAGPPTHDAPYLSLSDLEAVLCGHVVLERTAEDAVADLQAVKEARDTLAARVKELQGSTTTCAFPGCVHPDHQRNAAPAEKTGT